MVVVRTRSGRSMWGWSSATSTVALMLTFLGLQISTSAGQACTRLAAVYVSPEGSNAGCCGATNQPCATLARAVRRVTSGGSVLLQSGNHSTNGVAVALGGLPLTIAAAASDAASTTVLDCVQGGCLDATCSSSACSESVLRLAGFTIQNGRGASGGCLRVVGQGLSLLNMTFQSCEATEQGGAISLVNVTATVDTTSILASTVSSLTSGGGGMYLSGSNLSAATLLVSGCSAANSIGGGILAVDSTLSLSAKSLLTGCTAKTNGGALFTNSSQTTLTYSTMSFSSAGLGGCWFDENGAMSVTVGALLNCSAASPDVTDTTFGAALYARASRSLLLANSEVRGGNSIVDGGGLYLEVVPDVNISTCVFADNLAVANGAGLYLDQSTVEISNSLFTGNKWGLPYSQGGGIYASNTNLRLVGKNRFIANGIQPEDFAANQVGAGLAYFLLANTDQAPASLYVDGAHFEGNKAQTGGALYTAQTNTISLTLTGLSMVVKNSYFADNSATFSGGAVAAISALELIRCTFINNSAEESGGGLAVFVEYESVNVTDCTFTNNTAVAGNGGGMEIPTGGQTFANILRSRFEGNRAPTGFGGGLFHGGRSVQVDSSDFVANVAGIAGGGVEVEGTSSDAATAGAASQGTFTSCTFAGNFAPLGGGGLHGSASAAATLRACAFRQNNSTQGGAIFLADFTAFEFAELVCSGNTASEGGGCLSLQDSAQGRLTGGELLSNKAISEGGAAKIAGRAVLQLNGCNVSENTAPVGGAIWAEISSKLTAVRTNFTNNVADFMGGAVYQTHRASSTWQGCVFERNKGSLGGAIYADTYSQVTAVSTQWLANQGTALCLKGSSTCALSSVLFIGNEASANGHGGALWAAESTTVVVAGLSAFMDNRAQHGGAVYLDDEAMVTLNGSRFERNTAQEGGAVSAAGEGEVTVVEANFIGNAAQLSGGALALIGASSGMVTESNFTENQAGGDGAGVFLQRTPRADGSSAPLLCSSLTFNGSVAPNSQGAAFFDASFEPERRVNCIDCSQLTSADSFGTVPTYYRFIWPGQNDTGVNSTFRVLASSGDPIVSLQIMVLDSYGRFVVLDDTSIAAITPTPRISGLLTGTARNGIIAIPSVAVTVTTGDLSDLELEVTLSSPTDAHPPITRFLKVGFCQPGTYYSGASFVCETCPLGQWCAGGQPTELCPDGSFSFQLGASSPSDCFGCEGGLRCSGGNSTILEGFWLDTESLPLRPAVYGCDQSRGCAGFQYLGEVVDQCKPGYESRVCSTCSSGYYGFLSSCSQCSEGYKAAFPLVVLVVVLLWLAFNWLTSLFTGADIMVVEMQFLAIVGAYNLNYFAGTWISSVFQIFNITLFYPDFLGPQCVNESYGFAQRWVFTAALPWLGVGFYLVGYLVDDLRNAMADAGKGALDWLRPRASPRDRKWALVRSVCNLLDLMYLSVTIRCFQAFHWQTYDKKVVGADPTVLWLSSTHVAILPFAVVYTAFYVIGLPLLFSWVLFRGKLQRRLHERAYLEKYGVLYERYEPGLFWWYFPMTWGRRLAYAAIFVFWGGHPDMQAYLTFLLILVLGLVHYFVRPHKATALDVLVGVLFLGQYLYLLGGTANSYMTTYVSGEPAEAVAGTAVVLYLLAAGLIMALELQELWARFWVRQWAYTNQDPESQVKHPRAPLITLSSVCGGKREKHAALEQEETKELADGQLLPLEEVTMWFNPHAMRAFLCHASLNDLNLLQMIRVTYSYHAPTVEAIRQAGRILDALPTALRFSFINELFMDVDVEEAAVVSSTAPSTLMSHASSPLNRTPNSLSATFTGMSLEKIQSAALSADAGASLEKVRGLPRIRELRMLAESAAGDKRTAGDTLRLLLNPRYVETITAWLLYEEYEGRKAMKELLTKFNQWLLILPTESSLVGSPVIPVWEVQMRRRWRRFRLKLSL